MAISEPDRGAFEMKSRLNPPADQMDFEANGVEPAMPNGHNLKDSSPVPAPISVTSLNSSAHSANGHQDAHQATSTMTNGFGAHNPPVEPLSSLELDSSFSASGETAATDENMPPQLDQPDFNADLPSSLPDLSAVDLAPPVIQQPIFDVRDESQPQNVEPLAVITEQRAQQSLDDDHQMGGTNSKDLEEGTSSALESTVEPHVDSSVAVAPEAPQDTPAPPSEPTAVPPSVENQSPATQAPVQLPTIDPPNHPSVPFPEGGAPETPLEPAPSPVIQPDTSAPPQNLQANSTDEAMLDAPPSAGKMSREREDDDENEGPAAKRAKTEDESSAADFKIPEPPANDAGAASEVSQTVSQTTTTQAAGPPMTKPQQKYLQRTIGNVKRIAAAKAFVAPVDIIALKIPSYPDIVKNPMDLRTLEENLKAWKYPSVEACVADFNMIIQNSRTFNGADHPVTKAALNMKMSFDKHLEGLPGPEVTEPSASDRKKKVPDPMAIKTAPARRESRSSLPGSARSPVSATSPQTFALGPEGVPLIRRDSTIDGRPKREIHRPAPKDLPYANQKPKKKKYQWELKFCEKVLNELQKPKYGGFSYPFLKPVDPVALNIPTYHSVIKKPMDLSTIKTKLDHGEYENAKEFEADVRLMFQNCYKFNPPGDMINQAGHSLEGVFDSEWAKKRDWVDANTPASGPQSPGSSSDAEETEEEIEEEEDDEEEQTQLSKLQQQIAAMSRQVELITQKKKSPPVPSKKARSKPVKKETKKAPASSKAEKKAPSKPKKAEKAPYVTYEQKQDISNRINSLSESKMATALKIIRDNMPNLKEGVNDDELELDIDELSNEVLYKLLMFVRKHVPRPDDTPATRPVVSSSTAAPPRKKNKPMSKHEQEARIAEVQSGLSAFQKSQNSPTFQNVQQSIERPHSDEEDEDEDSESEEE